MRGKSYLQGIVLQARGCFLNLDRLKKIGVFITNFWTISTIGFPGSTPAVKTIQNKVNKNFATEQHEKMFSAALFHPDGRISDKGGLQVSPKRIGSWVGCHRPAVICLFFFLKRIFIHWSSFFSHEGSPPTPHPPPTPFSYWHKIENLMSILVTLHALSV